MIIHLYLIACGVVLSVLLLIHRLLHYHLGLLHHHGLLHNNGHAVDWRSHHNLRLLHHHGLLLHHWLHRLLLHHRRVQRVLHLGRRHERRLLGRLTSDSSLFRLLFMWLPVGWQMNLTDTRVFVVQVPPIIDSLVYAQGRDLNSELTDKLIRA